MSKRLNGLVALGAAGLLAASATVPAAAQDTTSIEMIAAQYTDDMQPYFDDLAARFMAENPDIEVTVQVVNWNDIDQVVTTRIATGEPPDIANLNYFAAFAAALTACLCARTFASDSGLTMSATEANEPSSP